MKFRITKIKHYFVNSSKNGQKQKGKIFATWKNDKRVLSILNLKK